MLVKHRNETLLFHADLDELMNFDVDFMRLKNGPLIRMIKKSSLEAVEAETIEETRFLLALEDLLPKDISLLLFYHPKNSSGISLSLKFLDELFSLKRFLVNSLEETSIVDKENLFRSIFGNIIRDIVLSKNSSYVYAFDSLDNYSGFSMTALSEPKSTGVKCSSVKDCFEYITIRESFSVKRRIV